MRSKLHTFLTLAASTASAVALASCVTTEYAEGERMSREDYNRIMNTLQGMSQDAARVGQAAAQQAQEYRSQIPTVGPYGQPPSTAHVYCRDLSGNIVYCSQLR